MILLEFLKSQSNEETDLGNLAKDVMNDRDFPSERKEEEIISYIHFRTHAAGAGELFEEMMAAYDLQKDEPADPMDLDINFSVLRAEQLAYLKQHFKADRAVIVGRPEDIYRVFTVDSASGQALRFDIYTTRDLNDLSIVALSNMNSGDLTRQVSLQEAIEALRNNTFEGDREPTEPNYSELLSYLENQSKG
ncbi:MAG: YozE SAM-like fold [Mucilaginibacter sp.]|nr:YozE SAM-like fold [Mucilaginibacter sp.]